MMRVQQHFLFICSLAALRAGLLALGTSNTPNPCRQHVQLRGSPDDGGTSTTSSPFPCFHEGGSLKEIDFFWAIGGAVASDGLHLAELQLHRALLYPPTSQYAFVPAFFDINGGGLVSLVHMHMHVPCATLRDYQQWMLNTVEQPSSSTEEAARTDLLHIGELEMPGLSLRNVSLFCGDDALLDEVPAPSITANAAHFLSVMRVLSLLHLPATIHIPRGAVIHLGLAWPEGGMTIHSRLQIRGASAIASVLDLSMLPTVLRFGEGGSLELYNLALINACAKMYTLNYKLGVSQLSTSTLWSLELHRGIRSLLVDNCLMVLPWQEVQFYIYWAALELNPYPEAAAYCNMIRAALPDTRGAATSVAPSHIYVEHYVGIVSYRHHITFLAAPHGLPQGFLSDAVPQAPVYCDSRQQVPADVQANNTAAPLFVVEPGTDVKALFYKVASLVAKDFYFETMSAPLYFPPVVLLYTNMAMREVAAVKPTFLRDVLILGRLPGAARALVPGEAPSPPASPGTPQLGTCTVAEGHGTGLHVCDSAPREHLLPASHVAAQQEVAGRAPEAPSQQPQQQRAGQRDVVVDLEHLTGAIHLRAEAKLMMQRLVLRRPVVASEASLRLGRSTEPSALPLWAVAFSRTATPQLLLDNVTIELPLPDYVMLYALAVLGTKGSAANMAAATLLSMSRGPSHDVKSSSSSSAGSAAQHQAPQAVAEHGPAPPPLLSATQYGRLLERVEEFRVSRYDVAGAAYVDVAKYSGWGVSGSAVRFVPEHCLNAGEVQGLAEHLRQVQEADNAQGSVLLWLLNWLTQAKRVPAAGQQPSQQPLLAAPWSIALGLLIAIAGAVYIYTAGAHVAELRARTAAQRSSGGEEWEAGSPGSLGPFSPQGGDADSQRLRSKSSQSPPTASGPVASGEFGGPRQLSTNLSDKSGSSYSDSQLLNGGRGHKTGAVAVIDASALPAAAGGGHASREHSGTLHAVAAAVNAMEAARMLGDAIAQGALENVHSIDALGQAQALAAAAASNGGSSTNLGNGQGLPDSTGSLEQARQTAQRNALRRGSSRFGLSANSEQQQPLHSGAGSGGAGPAVSALLLGTSTSGAPARTQQLPSPTGAGGEGVMRQPSGPLGGGGQRGSSAAAGDSSEHNTGSSVQHTAGAATSLWDPHKEVQQIAGELLGGGDDKLKLMEMIGQGASGQVYRGRWRNLDVAVKTVVFRDGGGSGGADAPRQRAIMEAAVCKAIVHRNVVCTYSYDIMPVVAQPVVISPNLMVEQQSVPLEWKLFLIQELCQATLRAALVECVLHDKDSGTPHMESILSILLDIVVGMEHIHTKNIIHGDLKPENVLLRADPQSPIGMVAKITDFGLCSTILPWQTHISNYSNGTPYYVAPEVVSDGKLTKTSDVYSFGVLMWVIYRCLPPWVNKGGRYMRNKSLGRYPETTPTQYSALCTRCMAKNPKMRPSFSDIKTELNAMLQNVLDAAAGFGWEEQAHDSFDECLPSGDIPHILGASPTATLPNYTQLLPVAPGAPAGYIGTYPGMPAAEQQPQQQRLEAVALGSAGAAQAQGAPAAGVPHQGDSGGRMATVALATPPVRQVSAGLVQLMAADSIDGDGVLGTSPGAGHNPPAVPAVAGRLHHGVGPPGFAPALAADSSSTTATGRPVRQLSTLGVQALDAAGHVGGVELGHAGGAQHPAKHSVTQAPGMQYTSSAPPMSHMHAPVLLPTGHHIPLSSATCGGSAGGQADVGEPQGFHRPGSVVGEGSLPVLQHTLVVAHSSAPQHPLDVTVGESLPGSGARGPKSAVSAEQPPRSLLSQWLEAKSRSGLGGGGGGGRSGRESPALREWC